MDDRELQQRLFPTPLFASFLGRARAGDLQDPDPARRSAAWAHWCLSSLTELRGAKERPYVALTLPGKFYDPQGRGPFVQPHVELGQSTLQRPDPEFPDRLALAGNALLFPWWVVPEVTALKRALLRTAAGPIAPLAQLLGTHREVLVAALEELSAAVAPRWGEVEDLLLVAGDVLAVTAAGDITAEEIAAFFPAASSLGVHVRFDEKLRSQSGRWAARRVGVWQLVAGEGAAGASLGVLTPRLTRSSLFADPLFRPARDSAAALLVRGVLLRRILAHHLAGELPAALPTRSSTPPQRLRAIVAQFGAKIPEASVDAAVHFLRSYPAPDVAWAELVRWRDAAGAVLTVSEAQFRTAHSEAQLCVRRAEEPPRSLIDALLPLAWDKHQRVVRVTFAKPHDEE